MGLLEAFLDGNLIVFAHRDVPGIIGAVGTIFGKHNINIAQMAVGRERRSAVGARLEGRAARIEGRLRHGPRIAR